jgi:hypothetical protein
MRNEYKTMVGKPEAKAVLKKPTQTWEDNIKTNLKEIRLETAARIHPAHKRNQMHVLVNTVMNPWVPQKADIFLNVYAYY